MLLSNKSTRFTVVYSVEHVALVHLRHATSLLAPTVQLLVQPEVAFHCGPISWHTTHIVVVVVARPRPAVMQTNKRELVLELTDDMNARIVIW